MSRQQLPSSSWFKRSSSAQPTARGQASPKRSSSVQPAARSQATAAATRGSSVQPTSRQKKQTRRATSCSTRSVSSSISLTSFSSSKSHLNLTLPKWQNRRATLQPSEQYRAPQPQPQKPEPELQKPEQQSPSSRNNRDGDNLSPFGDYEQFLRSSTLSSNYSNNNLKTPAKPKSIKQFNKDEALATPTTSSGSTTLSNASDDSSTLQAPTPSTLRPSTLTSMTRREGASAIHRISYARRSCLDGEGRAVGKF